MDYSRLAEYIESAKTLALSEQAHKTFEEILKNRYDLDEVAQKFVEKTEGDAFIVSIVAGILCNYCMSTEQF